MKLGGPFYVGVLKIYIYIERERESEPYDLKSTLGPLMFRNFHVSRVGWFLLEVLGVRKGVTCRLV